METPKFKFEAPGVYQIYEGKAFDQKPPVPLIVNGLITAPADFLIKRSPDPGNTIVKHNLTAGRIELLIDENSPYATKITGEVRKNPKFTAWGINENREYNTFELADKIKMNRHLFTKVEVAMKLVTELKNFKMKLDREMEASNNNRGTTKALVAQTIKENNIPESFSIRMAVFENEPPAEIKVEIYIDANTMLCQLVSPDLEAYIEQYTESAVNTQLARIIEFNPAIPVLAV